MHTATLAPPPAALPNAGADLTSVTQLLRHAKTDLPGTVQRLFQTFYQDLYRVARVRVQQDARSLDLSATALVNEAYMRLVQLEELHVADRQQFFAYAATVMRNVIVDMARGRLAQCRGGGHTDVPLDTFLEGHLAHPQDDAVLAVNDALEQLAAVSPRLAKIVEMRYFVGLSVEETAQALGVTERTVGRDWLKARSLLAAILAS